MAAVEQHHTPTAMTSIARTSKAEARPRPTMVHVRRACTSTRIHVRCMQYSMRAWRFLARLMIFVKLKPPLLSTTLQILHSYYSHSSHASGAGGLSATRHPYAWLAPAAAPLSARRCGRAHETPRNRRRAPPPRPGGCAVSSTLQFSRGLLSALTWGRPPRQTRPGCAWVRACPSP